MNHYGLFIAAWGAYAVVYDVPCTSARHVVIPDLPTQEAADREARRLNAESPPVEAAPSSRAEVLAERFRDVQDRTYVHNPAIYDHDQLIYTDRHNFER